MQKISLFHLLILQIQSILSPITRLVTLICDHTHYQRFWSPFNLCEIVRTCKNQLVSSVLSWDTVNFRVQRPDWPHSFLTMPHQKLFNQLLIFVNLYNIPKMRLFHQSAQEKCPIEKSHSLNGWEHFSLYLWNNFFFQIEDLYSDTANNINIHYRGNLGKINDQML